ncbi:cytidine deaminase [Prosthecomicrobium pneumaticum]|uniref:Cytidine deaminase n=1 Tax=Prosthecomicrobium pneumaticum TaxID=81895 RepID=A0A7W9L2W2_9HYPH|nr:cytidine deaminase [Prosthecomicrobium pneumaticum]MBB5753894.1 cytidine deaminase [Prosthecomicrobium pneumaticum]
MNELLFDRALVARERAHAPYSGFKVGAALRTESGEVYFGANVENVAFPNGWCAETSAIAQMIAGASSAPGRRIAMVCVVADRVDGGIVCTPCGGCRQRLKEFAGPDLVVHCMDPEGKGESFTLGELLPAAFAVERF